MVDGTRFLLLTIEIIAICYEYWVGAPMCDATVVLRSTCDLHATCNCTMCEPLCGSTWDLFACALLDICYYLMVVTTCMYSVFMHVHVYTTTYYSARSTRAHFMHTTT